MTYCFQFSLSWLPGEDENGKTLRDQIDLCYWPYPEEADAPGRSRGHHAISWVCCERLVREHLELTQEQQDDVFRLLERGGFQYPGDILPAVAARGIGGRLLLSLGVDLAEYGL
jgi:hypothetical protein